MLRVHLEVGDWAWIFGPGHKGKTSRHRVVHVFDLNGGRMYVIEIDTPMDPIYVVHDEFTVSDHKKKPIGMYRRPQPQDGRDA